VIGGTGRNGGSYPNEMGYGHPVEKAAVAWEILNRVDSSGYGMGTSVTYVISVPGQYGNYINTYNSNKVCEETYEIVKKVCRIWAIEKVTGEIQYSDRAIPPEYRWHKGKNGHNMFFKTYEDFQSGSNPLKWYDGYFA
jgi:acetoacetate decarboxylase